MFTIQSQKGTSETGARTFLRRYVNQPFWLPYLMFTVGVFSLIGSPTTLAETDASSAGSSTVIEVPSSDDEITLTFTRYSINNVHYFSAGVGVEERNASYPAYPLKLIFVQGERSFLADVTIFITESSGTVIAEIPSDHVIGPWLFIDLPTGTYTITAIDSHQRIRKKEVQVDTAGTKVIHFRWPAL